MATQTTRTFFLLMVIWEVLMIALFCIVTQYDPALAGGGVDPNPPYGPGDTKPSTIEYIKQLYPMFQDVNVMIISALLPFLSLSLSPAVLLV